MNPTEKLLADLEYWRNEKRDAEERLRVATAVLPGLEKSLQEVERSDPDLVRRVEEDREATPAQGTVPVQGTVQREDMSVSTSPEPPPSGPESEETGESMPKTLSGTAEQQVFGALQMKAPQSSEDLKVFVAKHGRDFSRGAINFAIRDLRKANKIAEVDKRGNLRFYAPRNEETES